MLTIKTEVFTEKQINYARRANMFHYMLYRGEGFNQVSGKTYEHEEHDSCRANDQTGVVTWFSQYDESTGRPFSSFNNAINFSMRFFNDPYEQAVQSLLDFQSGLSMEERKVFQKKSSPRVKFSMDTLRAKDLGYLTKEGKKYLSSRFISEKVIDWFERNHFLSSDARNNIVAKWYEFEVGGKKEPTGVDLMGIYRKPVKDRINHKHLTVEKIARATHKEIVTGSNPTGGFYFPVGLDFKSDPTLYVTEGPLESISYFELFKEELPNNSFFQSMSGLKGESVIARAKQIKEAYPEDTTLTVVLCVNNDENALEFVRNFHKRYKALPELNELFNLKLDLPKIKGGDWNEELEYKITGKLESREVKAAERKEAQKLIDQLLAAKKAEREEGVVMK